MAIRYSDVPQLQYGRQRPDNWRERFPPEAQPVANAPKNTSDPFVVGSPAGNHHSLCAIARALRRDITNANTLAHTSLS
jgi:hypothetical protein